MNWQCKPDNLNVVLMRDIFTHDYCSASSVRMLLNMIYTCTGGSIEILELKITLTSRRDVPVGVPLDLSKPTGMSCIGTYGENCKSDNCNM